MRQENLDELCRDHNRNVHLCVFFVLSVSLVLCLIFTYLEPKALHVGLVVQVSCC